MSDKFRVVVAGIITNKGDVLIGKKEEIEDHPISGQWHFPGGLIEEGEDLEEALEREIEEETDLNIDIHQLIDTYKGVKEDLIRVIYHCESDSRDAEALDDLEEVTWVKPENLQDELGELESEDIEERDNLVNFVEKLEKMPAF